MLVHVSCHDSSQWQLGSNSWCVYQKSSKILHGWRLHLGFPGTAVRLGDLSQALGAIGRGRGGAVEPHPVLAPEPENGTAKQGETLGSSKDNSQDFTGFYRI